ncbi:MAG: sigma-70 family RNA polymerase sigma factor [Pseudomonadota bacterium]
MPDPFNLSGEYAGTLSPARAVKTDTLAHSDQQHASLITQIAAGQEGAMNRFYDLTIDFAFSIAFAVLRQAEDAEEAVLDAYTQVWRTAGSYNPRRGSGLGWLAVLVRSRALDQLRRRRDHSDNVPDAADNNPGTGELLDLVTRGSALTTALASLNDAQQQVLSLAFLRDYSHSEIAEVLGMPLGTVKSHARRAINALRQNDTIREQ